jgi:RNA polymerase sigma-70 factor, ECF subfamily
VTGLLLASRAGDEAALARLTPLVHQELRRIAQYCMRGERAHHSLQATALVHEAYLRLVGAQHVNWQNRAHFLATAARLMRRILVDIARARRYQKRGGEPVRVSLGATLRTSERPQDLVAIDDALHALAKLDERKSRVVELRFFGGCAWRRSRLCSTSRLRPSCVTGSLREHGCGASFGTHRPMTPERLRLMRDPTGGQHGGNQTGRT